MSRTAMLSRRMSYMHPHDAAVAFEDAEYATRPGSGYRRRWWPQFGREVGHNRRCAVHYKTAGSFGTVCQEFLPEDATMPRMTIYTVKEAIACGKKIGHVPGLVASCKAYNTYEVAVEADTITESIARTILSDAAQVERHRIVFKLGTIGLLEKV